MTGFMYSLVISKLASSPMDGRVHGAQPNKCKTIGRIPTFDHLLQYKLKYPPFIN